MTTSEFFVWSRLVTLVEPGFPSELSARPLSSSLTPQERKAAIESGLVPAHTAGLTDQERRDAAFWSKKHGNTKEQTMKEKTDKFFSEQTTIGPNGERIKTRRLIEMS